MNNSDTVNQIILIEETFKPASPINRFDLFTGRADQIRRMVGAILQSGSHVILFGERGVGKTSLVSILNEVFDQQQEKGRLTFLRFNCASQENFTGLWQRVLGEIKVEFTTSSSTLGFGSPQADKTTVLNAIEFLRNKEISPDDIRLIFQKLPVRPILIFDEVDHIENKAVISLLADTVKALSDHSIRATLILVGVADSVVDLIGEHQSIERALVQIQLPRMSKGELREILDKSTQKIGMKMTAEVKDYIVTLSRGLPHYTHLLGQHSAHVANEEGKSDIQLVDLEVALKRAIENSNQVMRSKYVAAIHTVKRDTLHEVVLLACALADADELGFFTAGNVKRELLAITRRNIEISAFARHLTDFSSDKRGNILQRIGKEKQYRYRFINPLMQPFVIMKGIEAGKIDYSRIQKIGK